MNIDDETRVAQLAAILFDSEGEQGERSDAAMDLRLFPNDQAINVLMKAATAPRGFDSLLQEVGESLGEIWAERALLEIESLKKMQPLARSVAASVMAHRMPHWNRVLAPYYWDPQIADLLPEPPPDFDKKTGTYPSSKDA